VKRAAGLLFAAVVGAACMNGVASAPSAAHVHWLLYGDSLSDGAAPYLKLYDTVGDRHRQSTAPCDSIGGLDGDANAFAPDAVLLQFLGNPSCTSGPDQTQSYEQDLTTIARFWMARDVPVVMVLSPKTPTDSYAWARLAELEVAGTLGLAVRNAGAAVELPGEVFTPYLPCLPSEDMSEGCGAEVPDQIRVRAADGAHFGMSSATYSSGAFRFATAIAT
jgi:hypothetical protein